VQVHLCGVRGSSPAPGSDFCEIGGNTSCVAIASDGGRPSLVLDAGTGLRNLTALHRGVTPRRNAASRWLRTAERSGC